MLVYRKLACAMELAEVDALQHECEESFGSLPQAACNLFDRTRIRIRAQRLGVSSVSIANGRIIFQGLKCSRELTLKLKEQRALVYPKTEKVAYPLRRDEAGAVAQALSVLELAGGDDDPEE